MRKCRHGPSATTVAAGEIDDDDDGAGDGVTVAVMMMIIIITVIMVVVTKGCLSACAKVYQTRREGAKQTEEEGDCRGNG